MCWSNSGSLSNRVELGFLADQRIRIDMEVKHMISTPCIESLLMPKDSLS